MRVRVHLVPVAGVASSTRFIVRMRPCVRTCERACVHSPHFHYAPLGWFVLLVVATMVMLLLIEQYQLNAIYTCMHTYAPVVICMVE